MGADGYKWVSTSGIGCISNSGCKNKTKRVINVWAGHAFVLCVHSEKNNEVGRDGLGGQTRSCGGIEVKQEGFGAI